MDPDDGADTIGARLAEIITSRLGESLSDFPALASL